MESSSRSSPPKHRRLGTAVGRLLVVCSAGSPLACQDAIPGTAREAGADGPLLNSNSVDGGEGPEDARADSGQDAVGDPDGLPDAPIQLDSSNEVDSSNEAGAPTRLAMALGRAHTCVRTLKGGAKCWGSNGKGQLGTGRAIPESLLAVDVDGLAAGVLALAAGGDHSCAVLDGGSVKCWGANDAGQVGDGSKEQQNVPVEVRGLGSKVVGLGLGLNHSCAVTEGGAAWCWGINNGGQIGDNSLDDRPMPVRVIGLDSGVRQVAAGQHHTCALLSDGRVKCWGDNLEGQLGNNSSEDSRIPVDVVAMGSSASMISLGIGFSCATTIGGGVKCWGSPGQLGNNGPGSDIPVDVVGLAKGVSTVAAGDYHTCALLSSGGSMCWGFNAFGQVGNASRDDAEAPADVVGLSSGVDAVFAGSGRSCALLSDRRVKCWGANSSGALGNQSKTNSTQPVDVTAF